MSTIDISSALDWQDGLPRPQWDLIDTMIESQCAPDDWENAWIAVGQQWLFELGSALGRGYKTSESEHFLALTSKQDGELQLQFAEQCRDGLLSRLPDVANFEAPGKQIVIALRTTDDYYRYISFHYPDGEYGGSSGVHIRDEYPHVVLSGKLAALGSTLAHELTHVSLHHLSMPQWLEEGLAQMFEYDMSAQQAFLVNETIAAEHKRYWGKHGLDMFWRGESFSRPGRVQRLSYQLAEVLVRLMVEDARPGWFGWGRERQQRFFAFLREANASDCGESAAQTHLHLGLGDLAARFLGPGSWSPGL